MSTVNVVGFSKVKQFGIYSSDYTTVAYVKNPSLEGAKGFANKKVTKKKKIRFIIAQYQVLRYFLSSSTLIFYGDIKFRFSKTIMGLKIVECEDSKSFLKIHQVLQNFRIVAILK